MTATVQTSALPQLGPAIGDGAARLREHFAARLRPGDVPLVRALGAGGPAALDVPLGSGAAVLLSVSSVIVGPITGPVTGSRADAAAPCVHCLAARWQRLRVPAERDVLDDGRGLRPVGLSPFVTPFTCDAALALWVAVRDTVPDRADVADVYELDLQTLAVRRHGLVADAECPCRSLPPDSPERGRVELTARPKPRPGATRLRSLRDFDVPVTALVNPVCGAIGDRVMLDYTSPTTSPSIGRFRAAARRGVHEVTWSGQTTCFDDSKIAGVFEGLERHAGLHQHRASSTVVDSLDGARTWAHALDPRDCGVYSPEQYAALGRDAAPFDPARPIPWVWGWSLRDDRAILVPQRVTYYGSGSGSDHFVHECSNGCAGGSSIEEALLHGMIELIERDAFVLAWYSKARLPEIDPATCDVESRMMMDQIRLAGYDVRLFDCRIDLPVPVVVAVGTRRAGGDGYLCFAAGAALDPDEAVRNALSEVGSYVPSMPLRVADRPAEVAEMARDFARIAELSDHAAAYGLPEMAVHADFLLRDPDPRPMAQLYGAWLRERPRHTDLADDVRYCRDAFAAAGFDVIAVEQTTPEQELLGLRTACVVVPGLLPIDFGWHKQRALTMARTRTALRRAGMRDTDLDSSEINQAPHPFP